MTYKIFEYKILIKENYLDFLGHVNNAKYFELLEEARWDFLTGNNLGLENILEMKISPVVLGCNIQYKREVTNRERVIVYSQVLDEGKIFKLEQVMKNEKGDICAHAVFTCGFMDLVKRKLIEPPQEWLDIVRLKDK